MNCDRFLTWLDDGRPDADRAESLAHAQTCASCTAQLAAADEIDLAFTGAPAAPRGFADRVMARVAVTPQQRPHVLSLANFPLAPAIPWWTRVAFEPVCVLAVILGAALLWRGAAVSAAVTVALAKFAAWAAVTPDMVPAGWLQPTMLATLALAPVAVLLSQQLYRWSSSLAGPRHAHMRVR